MKTSTKTKIKVFWEKHWYKIIAVVGVIGVGIYEINKYRQAQPSDEEIEEAIATVGNNLVEPATDETKEDDWFESRRKDPERQLTNGGWVTDEYEIGDFVCHDGKSFNIQEFIVNDATLENVGTLGEDLVARIKEKNPDLDEFELGSVVIDICSRKGDKPAEEKKEE